MSHEEDSLCGEDKRDLSLEKMRIHERLVRVEHHVASIKEASEQDQEERAKFREELRKYIHDNQQIVFGDGKTVPGLLTRTDRLEQSHKVNSWVARTCGAGVLGLVVNAVWKFFTHKSA